MSDSRERTAYTPTSVEKLTREGHEFEVVNVVSERHVRFLNPGLSIAWSNEPYSYEFAGMSPEKIARDHLGKDAYYEFTKVTGELLVDGVSIPFSKEINESPMTFLCGEEVVLSDYLDDPRWAETARKLINRGFERAVFMKPTKDRPYRERMWPMGPGDRLVKTKRWGR